MYPILVDLQQFKILVVGGGKIATRKVRDLVENGGRPLVIAPTLTPELIALEQQKAIQVLQRGFQTGDTAVFQMIFACTDNPGVNQKIAAEITSQQLFNDTTEKDRSNFYNMAFVKNANLGLAATTFGQNPSRTKVLKTILTDLLHKLTTSEN